MRKPILIFIAFCLLLMGVVASVDAGGRETDTGRAPYDTMPVTLFDQDGNSLGISNQGANGLLAVTVDYAHHELHSGNHYVVTKNATLASGAKIQLLINTPSLPDRVHFLCQHRSSAEANIELWRDTTVSALGTSMSVNNNDDLVSDNSGTPITNAPTIVSAGTLLPGFTDHFGVGQNRGGESRGDTEVILRPDTLYLINATSEAANNDVTVHGSFYVDVGDAP